MRLGFDRVRVQATGVSILLLALILFLGARPVMAATSAGSGAVTQGATPDSTDCNNKQVPVTITNGTAEAVAVVVQEAQINEPSPTPTNQDPTPTTEWDAVEAQPSTIQANGGTSKVLIQAQGSGITGANYTIAVKGKNGKTTPIAGSPFSIGVCQGVQTGPGAAASNLIGGTASDALSGIAVSFVQGAAWMFQLTSSALVSNSDAAAVQAMWVVSNYDTMWALAIVLMLLLLFVAVIEYVANADGAGLIRLIWSDIPMAVLLTVFTLTLISTTLIVADELTAFVSAGNATQVSSYIPTLESVMKKANQPSDIGDALLALFVGAAVAVGSGVMWVEMLLRSVGLGLVAIFLPLAWAGRVWPKTRRWAVRAGEVMLALILFKPVMVGVFYMGVAALANGTLPGVSNPGTAVTSPSFSDPGTLFAGAMLICLAAFCPTLLMSLIPVGEMAARNAIAGVAARRAANAVESTARNQYRHASQAVGNTAGMTARHGMGGVRSMLAPVGRAAGATAGYGQDVAAYQAGRAVNRALNTAPGQKVSEGAGAFKGRVIGPAQAVRDQAEALRGRAPSAPDQRPPNYSTRRPSTSPADETARPSGSAAELKKAGPHRPGAGSIG